MTRLNIINMMNRFTIQSLTELPDDYSICEPPDPFPNSEVKPNSADGSVGSPHVRVGHRQASFSKCRSCGFFISVLYLVSLNKLFKFCISLG